MGGLLVSDPLDLHGARVVVAGLGVTGRAVRDVLFPLVQSVTTLDQHDDADLHDSAAVNLNDVDLVIASPGWLPTTDLFVAAQAHGIPVWSEVELAWQLRVPATRTGVPAPWLAITGTNGKTTTVEMLETILRAGGEQARAVGNVGRPLIEAVIDPDLDVLALELSSYQLHFTDSMSAEAAAVLNIAPDHIDWHGSFEAYAADKAKVFARAQLACVYPVGDALVEGFVHQAEVCDGAQAVGFTLGVPGPGQVGLVEHVLVDRAFHAAPDAADRQRYADEIATLDDLAHLAGPDGHVPAHTLRNALAAGALARAHGTSAKAVRDGLREFHTGRHRIEQVASAAGVTYVDDSKATNAHAAEASVSAFAPESVVWIAGGLAKGATFDSLVHSIRGQLRAVIVIGQDSTVLRGALDRHAGDIRVVNIDPGDTETVMQRAVEQAHQIAQPGDTVLLAPACASMDQFRSYAERGDAFVTAVRNLPGVAAADA